MLLEGLPNTEICPLDLGSNERQLRNSDLLMTYWIMGGGFCTAGVIFFTEVRLKFAVVLDQDHTTFHFSILTDTVQMFDIQIPLQSRRYNDSEQQNARKIQKTQH